jgi:hypothetical protein
MKITATNLSRGIAAITMMLALWLPRIAPAQQPLECNKASACEFQLYIENDSFGNGTDRYYTNGIKFGGGVSAEPVIEYVFKMPAQRVLERITDNRGNMQFGLFLGQNLYTPKRITVAQPQPFDRPWAAWLYVGGVAQNVEGNRLQTVELDLGMVGPSALGKPVQSEWHNLVNADEPRGWSNQLHDEPGVLLAYLEKWRYGPASGAQAVTHFGITLGNVMTLARGGGMVRVGHNMSGFGPDTIEPGGAMLQRTRQFDSASARNAPEWYVFAGLDARLVARNIFLDGNTFRNSASVDRRVFVYDLTGGISIRVAPVRISLTHVQRSSEFDTPLGSSGIQRFQSFNVGWEF